MRIQIKICGITSLRDARAAVEAGADALGFNFHRPSPRYVSPLRAARIVENLPPFICSIGVFVDEDPDTVNEIAAAVGLDRVQLHGSETPEVCTKIALPVIKAIRPATRKDLAVLAHFSGVRAFLADAKVHGRHGGTGQKADWKLARAAKEFGPVVLAGGLTPENVAEAIHAVEPVGVDVASGVERDPAKKDPARMRSFVEAVREAARG